MKLLLPVIIYVLHLLVGYTGLKLFRLSPIMSTIFANLLFGILCYAYLEHEKINAKMDDIVGFSSKQVVLNDRFLQHSSNWHVLLIYFTLFSFLYVYTQLSVSWILATVGDGGYRLYTIQTLSSKQATLLFVIFVAPFYEELFFRGVMYPILKEYMGHSKAFFLQAFVFAISHGTIVHLWLSFLSALFFATLYERFHRLTLCLFFHVLFNLGTFFIPLHWMGIFSSLFVVIGMNVILFFVVLLLYFDNVFAQMETEVI